MKKEITVDIIKDRMKDKLLSYMMPKVVISNFCKLFCASFKLA